jgi:small subunit ribosomal protein S9
MATAKKIAKVKKAPAPAKKRAPVGISAEERMESSKKIPVAKSEQKSAQPYFYANGKRKTSVSTVRLYTNGKGIITVNARTLEHYFPVFTDQDKIIAPLRVTNTQKMFDVTVKVFGGGIHSQAEAVRHGISKALLEYSAELRTTLKPLGFLTRDPRVKERKKYGLHRARRAPQWQKR